MSNLDTYGARRRAGRAQRSAIVAAGVAFYFAVSGYTGCQDRVYNGSKFAGEGSKTLTFSGRTDTPGALVSVQYLSNPSSVPDTTASRWSTGVTVRGSSSAQYWNDSANPYYDWGTGSFTLAHGTAWPLGGVLRLRTVLQTPSGVSALAAFDDDYSSCSNEHASESWISVGLSCLTRYPRPSVTHIVSTAHNPAKLADNEFDYPYYLNRTLSRFDPESNLGEGYYERLGYEQPNVISTQEIHTLGEFKTRYHLGTSSDVVAYYYNRGDLGLGREMHCRAFDNTDQEGVACYVTNYRGITDSQQLWGITAPSLEQPSISDAIARRNPLATVAMVYARGAAEPVKFIVFNGRGFLRADDDVGEERLLTTARLEYHTSDRSQNLPSNCTACHGGSVAVASTVSQIIGGEIIPGVVGGGPLTKVYLLPFDLQAFRYSTSNSTYSRANQEEAFRKLNALVLQTNVPQRVRDLINGWYGGDATVAGHKFDNEWVPPGWRDSDEVPFAANLYKNVFEPYCQGCHMTQQTYAFATAASFVQAKAQIVSSVCGNAAATDAQSSAHRMPHAEATLYNFWNSGARAHLIAALDARGACN